MSNEPEHPSPRTGLRFELEGLRVFVEIPERQPVRPYRIVQLSAFLTAALGIAELVYELLRR